LTERDKKLLTFMGVFVIMVLIGYYLIIPQLKKATEYEDEIAEQELLRDVNSQKVANLPLVEVNNQELEKLIDGAKENYYPMMESDEIDRLVTNIVIEKYGLKAYDLSIGTKQLANLSPYVYSKKKLTGESNARQKALNSVAPIITDDGTTLFGEISDDMVSDSGTTGLYMVPIQMRLSGDMENITRLLDDLALTEKKLRLVNYSVNSETITIPHDDGTEEIFTTESLNISVELYMCQD
jgi:hypothetical protein